MLDHLPQHHGTIFVTSHSHSSNALFYKILRNWPNLASLEIVFEASGFKKGGSNADDIFEDMELFTKWKHHFLSDSMIQDIMCCKNIYEFNEKINPSSIELKQLSIRANITNLIGTKAINDEDYWVPLSRYTYCRKIIFTNECSKEVLDLYICDYQNVDFDLNAFIQDLDRRQPALGSRFKVEGIILENSLAQKLLSGEDARLTRAMNDFFRYQKKSVTKFGISYDGDSGMNILEDIKPIVLKKMPNIKIFNYEKHFPKFPPGKYECGAPGCNTPEGFNSQQELEAHWLSNMECAMAQF